MPLIYFEQLNIDTKIGVWHITESEFFFETKVVVQRSITNAHKRLQHLAGRYLLKALFPNFPMELIKIADTRKPFLFDEAFHFSISHCGDYAAAIVSTTNRVGVDIEIPAKKVDAIQHKFLTRQEQIILASIHYAEKLTMAWSVKEAVFKWYGLGEVDFKKHIQLQSLEKQENYFLANVIFTKEEIINFTVKSILINGNNLSWVVT